MITLVIGSQGARIYNECLCNWSNHFRNVTYWPIRNGERREFIETSIHYISSLLFLSTLVPPHLKEIFPKPPNGWLKLGVVYWTLYIPCFLLSIHIFSFETFYGFFLAYPNCQYHYSCSSETLLSKIRVPWTQTLWYHDC